MRHVYFSSKVTDNYCTDYDSIIIVHCVYLLYYNNMQYKNVYSGTISDTLETGKCP